MRRKHFLLALALFCQHYGMQLSMATVATLLNAAGYRTLRGQHYQGKRGTYRLVATTYRWLKGQGQTAEASLVFRTFV
jgi:hypothetical protein